MIQDSTQVSAVQDFYNIIDCVANFATIVGILITLITIYANRKKIKSFFSSIDRFNLYNSISSILKTLEDITKANYSTNEGKACIKKHLGELLGKINGSQKFSTELSSEAKIITELLAPKMLSQHRLGQLVEQIRSKLNEISADNSKTNK